MYEKNKLIPDLLQENIDETLQITEEALQTPNNQMEESTIANIKKDLVDLKKQFADFIDEKIEALSSTETKTPHQSAFISADPDAVSVDKALMKLSGEETD